MSVATVSFKVPHLVYKWTNERGYGYIQVDALMLSGACKDDVFVEIMPDGKRIKIKQRIPNLFLHPRRLNIQANANDLEVNGSKLSAMNQAVTDYRDQFSDPTSNMEVEMVIKLPERVEPKFVGPNKIETYAHDYKAQRTDDGTNNTYKILHIDLMCLAKPKEIRKKVKQGTGVLGSPYMDGIDDEDYDSDDSNWAAGGEETGRRADQQSRDMVEDEGL